jgi:hypothetical protein
MADWFETRFKEPVDSDALDPAFAERMRALVVEEWHAEAAQYGAHERTEVNDLESGIIMIDTEERAAVTETGSRRRRSPGMWLIAAAAVVTLAVVGALLVSDGDDEGKQLGTAATTAPTQATNRTVPPDASPRAVPESTEFDPLEPGTYFIDPDGDPITPLRVVFDIHADGWTTWLGTVKFGGGGHVVLTVTTISNLVEDGCRNQVPANPAVGPSVDDLATALSQLAPFKVTSPPTDITVLGYRGKHVELTVPDLAVSGEAFTDCFDRELHSWFSPIHDDGRNSFYGYNAEPGRTEEFFILDVEGTRLVLSINKSPASPPEDVAEVEAIFDSIRIEP